MPFVVVFVIVIAIIVGIVSFRWQLSRGGSILEQWAAENGYQLISSERRSLRRGPFFLTTSKGQEVYFITVQLPDGTVKKAWARCGGMVLGMMSDAIDVRWDDSAS